MQHVRHLCATIPRSRTGCRLGGVERPLRGVGAAAEVGICVWSLDIPTGRATVSPTCSRLFGVELDRLTTFEGSQAVVHPEDRQVRADAIQRALREGGRYEVDYRVERTDGSVCWLRSKGSVRLDERRRPLRHRGVVISIDAQKRAEADLRAREAHLR